MTFVEAVKDLAQQYGLQIPEEDASPQDRTRAAEQRQNGATSDRDDDTRDRRDGVR